MQNQSAQILKSKALTALDTGKLQQALKKAQLGLKKYPKDPDFHAISGFVLTELKQYKRSIPHFVEASRMKPHDPQFVENLANALMQTNQIPKALEYAERKLEVFPNNKELTRVLDEIHLKGQNWRTIIDYVTKKLEADPENATLLNTRARAYEKIGRGQDASDDVNRAFALAPEDENVAYHQAINLHQNGDKKRSIEILQDILAKNPMHLSSLSQMSMMVGKEGAAGLMDAVQKAIEDTDEEIFALQYATANLTSKTEGLQAAMPHYAKANRLQHEGNPYDPNVEDRKFDAFTKLFPVDTPPPVSDLTETPVPIFVVGQPRSGTTLMEMMLSSLPDITGCGELMTGPDLAQDYADGTTEFNAEDATKFAQDFRRLMPPVPEDATAFVDKMPHNFQRVGFLLAAFPNAKVINMLRDPRDVGLSKWIRLFPAGGMRYASDQTAIAHTANLYRRYMTHWIEVFGDRILTVPYEELVADPKTYSQQVADFCGIEWSETMMHPEENTKQVRTASVDQVRKKISTKSIGGWRDVSDHLQPMLNGLDPALWPEYDFD